MATLIELEASLAALIIRVTQLENENITLVSRLTDLETADSDLEPRIEWAEDILGGPTGHRPS